MVESLKELNRICQKPRYKEIGNWMVRHITRDLAIPFTWLLLHTPISANGVTLLGIVTVFIASFFLATPSSVSFLIGALLFQLWYVLDHVDGQVARYRKQSSLTGIYFDYISHYVTNSVIFFGLGLRAYFETGGFLMVLLAFVGSFAYAVFQSFFDCKYRAYYAGLLPLTGKKIRFVSLTSSPFPLPLGREDKGEGGKKSFPRARRAFSLLYKLCEIHVFMNLLTLVALLNFWWRSSPLFFFLFYSFLVPFVVIMRIAYTVKTRAIDTGFQREFEVVEE